MQVVKRTWIFVFALCAAVVSCDPNPEAVSTLRGAEYFPLQAGSFWVYDVDSTHVYLNTETSFSFELKISVINSFTNGSGNLTYVMRREKRSHGASTWTAAGTWSAWVDARNAVLAEGNNKFIKLQFPIDLGIQWNGNALNNMGGDDFCDEKNCDAYLVTSVDPEIVVTQSNEPDQLVKYDLRTERYTKDVGLTRKEMTVLEYCTAQNCFGKQFVNEGVKYSQTLIDHGQL